LVVVVCVGHLRRSGKLFLLDAAGFLTFEKPKPVLLAGGFRLGKAEIEPV
jgi:hypothetical protein